MLKLGVTTTAVNQALEKAPVVLKSGLSLGNSRAYADAVQNAGGRVAIREQASYEEAEPIERALDIKSFESFAMCPMCGHKQLRTKTCVKCGHAFEVPFEA